MELLPFGKKLFIYYLIDGLLFKILVQHLIELVISFCPETFTLWGFGGWLLHWIQDFLLMHKEWVVLEGFMSDCGTWWLLVSLRALLLDLNYFYSLLMTFMWYLLLFSKLLMITQLCSLSIVNMITTYSAKTFKTSSREQFPINIFWKFRSVQLCTWPGIW